MNRKKVVYIAHPFRGNGTSQAENVARAKTFVRWAYETGYAPQASWIIGAEVLGDPSSETEDNRELALQVDERLVQSADELWLCGDCITPGMAREMNAAFAVDIPVRSLIGVEPSNEYGPWKYWVTLSRKPVELVAHLERQKAFSLKTFGPGQRTAGVLDHIRKELKEIEHQPGNIEEWLDVVLLAFDGAWRAGYTPQQIADALLKKQGINERRKWPDWRTAEPGKAIEHIRSEGVNQ